MNKTEFFTLLDLNRIDRNLLAFDNSVKDGYVVRYNDRHWEKLYRERGQEYDVVGYPSESDALINLFEELLEYYGPGTIMAEHNRQITKATKDIEYREALLNKASNNILLTEEEQTWLETHSIYNKKLGYPYCNMSVKSLKANTWYLLNVEIKYRISEINMIPIISVSSKKGWIVPNFKTIDHEGNTVSAKSIKKIGLRPLHGKREFNMRFQSEIGFLTISYVCEHIDKKTNKKVMLSSSANNIQLAMLISKINDNKFQYNCKSPVDDSFGAMIFTVEWIEEDSIT